MPRGVGQVAKGRGDRQGGRGRTAPRRRRVPDVKIRKPGESADKPDAVYKTDVLERWGGLYADGDLARQSPVTDLIAFAKVRKGADKR